MGTEEKKFRLDELPDKGSEPEIKPDSVPKPEKKSDDPRIKKLKTMSDKERVEAMGQRWYFDRPVQKWGWLVVLLILFGLEKSGHMKTYQEQRDKADADQISGGVIDAFGIDSILRHPLYFAILIPLFFKFRESSQVFFEITFDGIISVTSIKESMVKKPNRVMVKWNEITGVVQGTYEKRDILIVMTAAGPAIEMIWDIEDVKKKVVKQVVKGLVSNKNPFREFMEKEVA